MLSTANKSVSSVKLANDLGITQKSAWHLAHRIRTGYITGPPKMQGPLEYDETYVGGINKNRSLSKRHKGGHGGPFGKMPVIGVRDRTTGLMYAESIPNVEKATIHTFVRNTAAPGAVVYTDENRAYNGLPYWHEYVNHTAGEYIDGYASTNSVESFWALLKRAYKGVFHWLSYKHLQRYVTEFCGRFNMRGVHAIDHIAAVIKGMDRHVLTYRQLIEPPTVPLGKNLRRKHEPRTPPITEETTYYNFVNRYGKQVKIHQDKCWYIARAKRNSSPDQQNYRWTGPFRATDEAANAALAENMPISYCKTCLRNKANS